MLKVDFVKAKLKEFRAEFSWIVDSARGLEQDAFDKMQDMIGGFLEEAADVLMPALPEVEVGAEESEEDKQKASAFDRVLGD